MKEYHLKGTYEPGSLEEVVGEVIVPKPKNSSNILYYILIGVGLDLIIRKAAGGTFTHSMIDLLRDYVLK